MLWCNYSAAKRVAEMIVAGNVFLAHDAFLSSSDTNTCPVWGDSAVYGVKPCKVSYE
jgi:hypothetical protein